MLFDVKLFIRLYDDVFGEEMKLFYDWKIEKILFFKLNN